MVYIALFVVGSLVGMFSYYIENRLCNGESIVKPGFHCENCNHRLSWYESIPVVSYILLQGKCKKCKIKLSKEYIIYEILAGILFPLSYYLYGFSSEFFIMILLFTLLVNIYITDFKYMIIHIIPIIITIVGIILTYLISSGLLFTTMYILLYLYDGIFIFLILLGIKLLGNIILKKETFGWGDILLSIIAGLLFGFKGGLVFIIISLILALPYGIINKVLNKKIKMPFGPFMVTSMCLLYIFYSNISELLSIIGVSI
ncbi:MAG: prepilin peptidase [Bacilli bacterium]|nr:prepilin peptidase [Bacilli bacterium]